MRHLVYRLTVPNGSKRFHFTKGLKISVSVRFGPDLLNFLGSTVPNWNYVITNWYAVVDGQPWPLVHYMRKSNSASAQFFVTCHRCHSLLLNCHPARRLLPLHALPLVRRLLPHPPQLHPRPLVRTGPETGTLFSAVVIFMLIDYRVKRSSMMVWFNWPGWISKSLDVLIWDKRGIL